MKTANEYRHQEIGQEIRSISGCLSVFEEYQLPYQGRKVLCIVYVGIIDNACCGAGGCISIEVPGYLVSQQLEKDDQGRMVSRVMPVEEEQDKAEISAILSKRYPHAQISFA
jgi:hypothetical protein